MADCHLCSECGVYSPTDEWDVFDEQVDDDVEGYVDDAGDFHAFDVEARARCPHCGEVSEFYL